MELFGAAGECGPCSRPPHFVASQVVLVGSGFIGMEMASALVSMGVDVTVVGRALGCR